MYLSKERLTENEKAKFILIEDTSESCGRRLFKAILKLFFKEQSNPVCLICYDGLHSEICAGLNIPSDQIRCLDAFSDPLNWNQNESVCNALSPKIIQEISGGKAIVCIDSLTPLLLHNSADQVYRSFHQLLQKNADMQIIALLHCDAHCTRDCNILENIASTVLRITSNDDSIMLCTTHYPSGKVSESFAEYKINDTFEISMLRNILSQKQIVVKHPDPTAHLTFNLKLKDDEKKIRGQLQLPYVKAEEDNSVNQNVMEDYYYDEDDPDDDLVL